MSTLSSTSPEDNRLLRSSNPRSRVFAKTVSVPVCPQPPLLLSPSTPERAKSSVTKSADKLVSDAPGIQSIPRDATADVDLTASSSTSVNFLPEVPLSVKSKATSPANFAIISCPDLIPISSDDESSAPKLEDCSKGSNLAVSGLPNCDVSGFTSDLDGNISSASNSLRTSSRYKKQTSFYGSPIRHSLNLINSPIPSSSTQASPDRRVSFAKDQQETSLQSDRSRVCSPSEAGGFTRKFTRFPTVNSSWDNPLRRNEN